MVRDDFARSTHEPPAVLPLVMGRTSQIVAGHHLAAAAGRRMLDAGGTAIDAGIAAGVALGVLLFDNVNYAGVAPIMLRHAPNGRLVTIDGVGRWPAAASCEYFERDHGGAVPPGILQSVTPAAPDAWLTALARFGTLTAGEVLEPAWELAHEGAPIATKLASSLRSYAEDLSQLAPSTVAAFFAEGRPPKAGELFARPELANVLKAQMDEEARARKEGCGRAEAIGRARDLFYSGWIGEEICRFQEDQGGLLDAADLRGQRVSVEPPLSTDYHGYRVHVCGPWSQGPVLAQALNLLERFELGSLAHNSPESLHLIVEALKLAFADRENFYGDPEFVEVPIEGLLSKRYAELRAGAIDPALAAPGMPESGDPWAFQAGRPAGRSAEPVDVDRYRVPDRAPDAPEWGQGRAVGEWLKPALSDTSYVAAVDAEGNFFSATPSDPVLHAPVIPKLGFSCSCRGYQSRVYAGHPSAVAPGRRPRLTPNPAIVTRGGEPLMALGCPGGDAQPQGMLQVLLNLVHFGMDPQQAVEAPRVATWSFPDSFAPHPYFPGRVDAEARIPRATLEALARLGHRVAVTDEWTAWVSATHLVLVNPLNGTLIGGCDPREDGATLAW